MRDTFDDWCPCCRLMQRFTNFQDGETRLGDKYCTVCCGHLGEARQVQKRHQDHENMLRERLTKSSAWAKQTEDKIGLVREQVAAALESRNRAVRYLQRVNDLHALRPDGSCMCGARRECKTAAVLYERWPQIMIERADKADARENDRWPETSAAE